MTLGRLMAQVVGMVGSRFLGAGIGFISQLVIARLMPPADVGHVFMGMSAAALISLMANGGYAMLALTQLPKLATHGRDGLIAAFHAAALRDTLRNFFWIGGFVIGFVVFMPVDWGIKLALLFGLLTAPASSLLRYNGSAASSARKFKLSYIPDFLVRPSLILLALVLAWALSLHLTMVHVLVIFTCLTFLTAIGQTFLMGGTGVRLAHLSAVRQRLATPLRKRAVALTIVSAVAYAFADIVTLVAGFVLPANEVAVVGVCVRLAALAGFVLQAAQTFVLPDLTQAMMERDSRQSTALLMRVNLTTLGVSLAALFGAMLLGEFTLGLFGPDYVQGATLLTLLLVGQSVRALGGMNQHILSMNGYQLRTAGACVLALVFLVCLVIIFSHALGLIGLGYAVIVAELVWAVVLAAQAGQMCGQRGDLLWLAVQAKTAKTS